MKNIPLKKYANAPNHARVNVYHCPTGSQVEIYWDGWRETFGGYVNDPKSMRGAGVRYVDGQWCWVMEDEA